MAKTHAFAVTGPVWHGAWNTPLVLPDEAPEDSDAEVMEIVVHVALNTLTNYVNEVAQTEIDFPEVDLKHAA